MYFFMSHLCVGLGVIKRTLSCLRIISIHHVRNVQDSLHLNCTEMKMGVLYLVFVILRQAEVVLPTTALPTFPIVTLS